MRPVFPTDPRILSRNHYLHTSHLLDTNHLINIRFLWGKEFRCYLIVRSFKVKKRCPFLSPSPIHLKNIWKLSRCVTCEFSLRWNCLLLLVLTANGIFTINLTLDRHEETYFSSWQEAIQGNWGQITLLFQVGIIFHVLHQYFSYTEGRAELCAPAPLLSTINASPQVVQSVFISVLNLFILH